MMNRILAACFLACLLFALPSSPVYAIDAAQFHRDLSVLTRPATRMIGSEGYYQTAEFLQSEIRSLPNVELRRHDYPVMVPVTRRADLTLPGGQVHQVYPFWPAQVRVSSTPPEGIRGRLVYAGTGEFEQIPTKQISGQIAVLEAASGQTWSNAPYMGARAVLILGSGDVNHAQLRHHELSLPINLPRFYVPEGPLAERLRAGAIQGEATLVASVGWQRKTASNFYALVKGLRTVPQGWPEGSQPPAALMFSVPFDSTGLVPDLANGASQAVQAAAALGLLRDFSRQPPDRPVVVFFGGADGIQFLATRNMLLALAEAPRKWRREQTDIRRLQDVARAQVRRAAEVADRPQGLDVTDDRRLIDRIVKIIETDTALEQDQLFRLRLTNPEELSGVQQQRLSELERRQIDLSRIKGAFQQKPSDLALEAILPSAREYVRRTIARLDGEDSLEGPRPGLIQQYDHRLRQLQDRIDLYQWLATAVGRNPEPEERQTNERPIELLVGLDFSDRSPRVGPLFYGMFQRQSNITDIQDYAGWFTRTERAVAEEAKARAAAEKEGRPAAPWSEQAQWWGRIRDVVDFEPLTQARAPQTYLCGVLPIASEMAQAWGVPGMSFITLDDLRLRRDTPADTLANLDVGAIVPQVNAVQTLLTHAANAAGFRGPVERKRQYASVEGQVVSPAPGRPVPDLPREGFLATYYYANSAARKIPQNRWLPWTLGVRRNEVQDCDAEGRYRFEGLPKLHNDLQLFAVMVYRLDPDSGAVTAASDLGKQAGDIKFYADIKKELNPLRSLVFNCEEVELTGLFDPRFMQSLGEVIPLDARRNAEPQRFNLMLHNQMMAGFVEPGSRNYFCFRYGRVGNRLLLLNMAAPGQKQRETRGEGLGFTVPQLNEIPPLSLVTTQDFWRLDERRLEEYRKAGVSSKLVDDLHREASKQLDDARAALAENRGMDFLRHANGAWANEARVYDAAQSMARDVIRAAIFLLLLCVPFAFCMERLLVGAASVYRQIAWILLIFAVMTAALWSFHPAFKISSSPLIIILAFAIIFMSVVVIWVVYGKFDTELKRIRSGRGTAQAASFARASVLMSAVLLGIANMRKRKFRTALTSITIVLITFAVLCFTSSTAYVGSITLPTGVSSSHSGVLLRQRGFRPMPQNVMRNLQTVVGNRTLVERWWNVSSAEPKDQLHLIRTSGGAAGDGGARVVPVVAALGLSPGESNLWPDGQVAPIAQVIGPEKFARLEKGEKEIVYLAATVANQLQVREGDRVRLCGIDLTVAGIYDAAEFDQKVFMLSGEPLAPLKYSKDALDAGGRRLDDTAVESLDLDENASAAELASSYEHLSASQFVIVPSEVAKVLPNSTLRTIGLKLDDEKQVREVTDELTRRFALATFAGYDDGVRMVAASELASVSGAGQVAIPLAIAGLIIFNTMMGSIAERKREIHVYTSLGLAPVHVGALFVAEAMTYGLIGTVFGYVIGQGVGTALLKLGWLGDVTLNYSGTSAMITMGLILLIVLLSALVPARLASKIAAPSIDRTWRVPLPKGDEIIANLPFTINKTAAEGALAYLAEYFDAHQEGSIGKFSAGKVEAFTFEDDRHVTSRGLKTVIWLTPFDLGVRQHLMLLIHPGQFPDIYDVQVVLQRLSGDDGSWYRMNRTFLTELRKQFLQWRSLSPQRMLEYVEESKQLFRETPEQVVTTAGGEAVRLA